MKPMPDARENRRLADEQTSKAEKHPAEENKDPQPKKRRDHESSARSIGWRNSNLDGPK